MVVKVDYYFNYINVIRFILVNKLNYLDNLNFIPSVKSIHLFFSIKNTLNFDESQNYNFFYFFKFFLGKLPIVTRFSGRLHLGEWYYNYNVELTLEKKDIYSFLYFLSNDILFNLKSNYVFINKDYFYKNYDYLFINILDVTLFSELKSNIGLFDLKIPLNIKIFFSNSNVKRDLVLMKQLKLKFF